MKTVAIISEYNPFHTGHEYHLKKIREEFGDDTRIIAIMSGNFTQRGEPAIAEKSLRAECAVRCGVNLVLEIPFPFSASSAEIFADAAVAIADSIGVVDYLSFGSEHGDIGLLSEIAENMQKEEFQKKLADILSSKDGKHLGYPKALLNAYSSVFYDISDIFKSNNILALEYIKALRRRSSRILPHTIKREGASYTSSFLPDAKYQSASAIRELLRNSDKSALDYIPYAAKNTIMTAVNNSEIPCDEEKLSAAVIAKLRLSTPSSDCDIYDAEGGLYNRLQKHSFEATDISSLIMQTDTKKYTTARIRRAIWNSFFGVTSSSVKALPEYTRVLAMDSVGFAILKQIKKIGGFSVITKPSADSALSLVGREQKRFSDRADAVFQLTKPNPTAANLSLTTTPFILNDSAIC